MRALATVALGLVLAAAASAALGQSGERANDGLVLTSEGFLNAHPDMKYRLAGLDAQDAGNSRDAFKAFKRAARYADKPSQAMIGEMLWTGEGVEQDRALAYAWMDLAAERGFAVMIAKRERYWSELSEAERERAIEVGQAIYAEYGDDVAKRRLETVLKRARYQTTGSRTGAVGALKIELATPAGFISIDGATFYHPDYWQPERYWAWQEKQWKDPPKGVVDIGEIVSESNETPKQ